LSAPATVVEVVLDDVDVDLATVDRGHRSNTNRVISRVAVLPDPIRSLPIGKADGSLALGRDLEAEFRGRRQFPTEHLFRRCGARRTSYFSLN